jgi:hypothetical protein
MSAPAPARVVSGDITSPPPPASGRASIVEVKQASSRETSSRADTATPSVAARTPDGTHTPDDQLWQTVLAFAQQSPAAQARLRNLRFQSFDGATLKLAIDQEGARSARFLSAQTGSVAEFVQRATGRNVKVEINVPAVETQAVRVRNAQAMEQVRKMPLVQTAMHLFDAVATSVQDAPPPAQP